MYNDVHCDWKALLKGVSIKYVCKNDDDFFRPVFFFNKSFEMSHEYPEPNASYTANASIGSKHQQHHTSHRQPTTPPLPPSIVTYDWFVHNWFVQIPAPKPKIVLKCFTQKFCKKKKEISDRHFLRIDHTLKLRPCTPFLLKNSTIKLSYLPEIPPYRRVPFPFKASFWCY